MPVSISSIYTNQINLRTNFNSKCFFGAFFLLVSIELIFMNDKRGARETHRKRTCWPL